MAGTSKTLSNKRTKKGRQNSKTATRPTIKKKTKTSLPPIPQFLLNVPTYSPQLTQSTNLPYHHRPNIVSAASQIYQQFSKHSEVVCCAEMQSGKTDVMKRVIYIAQQYPNKLIKYGIRIKPNNIYLVLCASSINLKMQLQSKLPEIQHNIFHLNDIQKFLRNQYEYGMVFAAMVDHGLIIFDECHCDAETGKTIDKFRQTLLLDSKDYGTQYYKLGFSATPYEQISGKYPKVIMYPGPNYYGLINMFESTTPVVFQAKDLTDTQECEQLFSEIIICNMYYIIRLPNKKQYEDEVMRNIERLFKKSMSRLDTYIYDMHHRSNINSILDIVPVKPTVIYLKDKLRVGEYLNTKNVYLVHDDSNNGFTHTTVQSLIGRCCGYYKKKHQVIVYCDYNKAYQHYEWIKSDYSIKKIPTNTKYISRSTGEIKQNCIY